MKFSFLKIAKTLKYSVKIIHVLPLLGTVKKDSFQGKLMFIFYASIITLNKLLPLCVYLIL